MCSDLSFMEGAIELGRRSLPLAGVNPAVGAVLVAGGRVLGEGYHHGPGTPHAEAAAIAAAFQAAGSPSTLPAGLDPLLHAGALLPLRERKAHPALHRGDHRRGRRARSLRVQGPQSPRLGPRRPAAAPGGHRGGGGPAGSDRAAGLLESFSVSIRDKRPFIRLKWAQSLDGRVACRGGASQWITNEAARAASHELRSGHDAVMIGANTLRVDDPQLTAADGRGAHRASRCPADSSLREGSRSTWLPASSRLSFGKELRSSPRRRAPPWSNAAPTGFAPSRSAGDEAGLPDLEGAFRALYADGIGSVMVEGGAALVTSLLKGGLWDALTVFVAPLILGEGIAAVGDLGVLSPDRGIAFEDFHFESGAGFARIDATRGRKEAEKEEARCSRA